jgi:hypothetical protein
MSKEGVAYKVKQWIFEMENSWGKLKAKRT